MTELKEAILKELSEKISGLIGYYLGSDHIHSIQEDGAGYYYYIQNLEPGYPVLVMYYRGPLVLLLPFDDAQRLNLEEVSVDDYIANSHFNYGRYWGGGGMISGGYWRPFEDGTGIHDKERISRYFHILSCRTHKVSSGYGPTESQCQKCQLDATSCPFSPLNQTGSWDNEVQEVDRRRELFDAISERVQNELGFKVVSRMPHDGDQDELRLVISYEEDTVEAFVSKYLLNELLYYPNEKYDLKRAAESFTISISRPFEHDWRVILPKESAHKREICLDFWRKEIEEYEKFRNPAPAEDVSEITSEEVTKMNGLRYFVANLFNRIAKG